MRPPNPLPGYPRGWSRSREAARAGGIIAGMRVLLASEPGAAERPNEDFAAAIPGLRAFGHC